MSAWDYVILLVYIAGSLVLGIACRGRQETAQDYFTASGQMGGTLGTVLVGLSIAATLFSGISFLAYPSMVYQHGPGVVATTLSFPLSWVVLRCWFLPRYFAANGRSPYDIIEFRVGVRARLLASIMFILLRLSWMSALLYAPMLILMAAGGLSERFFWPVVIVTGACCTLYTVVGGIRGVVVTDALQFVVILASVILIVATQLSGLTAAQVREAFASDASLWGKSFGFGLNISETYNLWALVIGFTVVNLSNYIGDQMSLQRYLSLGNVRAASRSFAFNIIAVSVVTALLAIVGVLLRAWYSAHPDAALPAQPDRLLPYFIAQQLPHGIIGIVLAAILAATMSSMTSGINALASCVTHDLIAPRWTARDPRKLLAVGRVCSLAIGVVSTGGVMLVMKLGSLWQIATTLFGIFLGPLLGMIVIACTGRARPREVPVLLGAVAGFGAGVLASRFDVNSLWIPPIAFGVSVILPYVLNLGDYWSRAWRHLSGRHDRIADRLA